jgi:hypothetical protein
MAGFQVTTVPQCTDCDTFAATLCCNAVAPLLSRSSDLLLRNSEEIAIKFFKMNSIGPRDEREIADCSGIMVEVIFQLENVIGGSFQVRENFNS